MSLVPIKDGRFCLTACSKEKIHSGLCSCVNSSEHYYLLKQAIEHIAMIESGHELKIIKTRRGDRFEWVKKQVIKSEEEDEQV